MASRIGATVPPDNHVHTEWSWDAAAGSMEASCARALELGLPSIAFTEHVDATRWVLTAEAQGLMPPARIGADGRFGGPLQLIEAGYEDGKLYPRRTLKALSAHLPALRRRYPKNNDYAKATLPEIFGADRLDAAQRFEATELRSGVFLSQPDGSYRFEPLPRIAQISAIQGIVAGDFDGDGHADLYAVQNSYAPVPSVGRFDGGLSQLLRGDGLGHFTAVEPIASGLVVPGDAKALVVLDLDGDGWPDFLVSRNNATTLAWRNTGASGRHSFRVLLEGPRGNPTAIGARLTLELTDGSRQQQELQAGSGYYSQSAPGCFFGYPDGNSPRQLTIRWPDGSETKHNFGTPPPPVLTLSRS